MRWLTAIRHAKSSWKQPHLDDFDRPLNRRGRANLPEMAQRFARSGPLPDLIVASPAKRAEATAEGMADAVGLAPAHIVRDRTLYLASTSQLLEAVRGLDDAVTHAALIGHNPGLTAFVNLLCNAAIRNVPTCGVVRMQLDLRSWREADAGCAELLDFDFPKRAREVRPI